MPGMPPPPQLQELVDVLRVRDRRTRRRSRTATSTWSPRRATTTSSTRCAQSSILRRRSSAEVQQLFAAFGIAQAEQPLRIPGDPAEGRLARWCVPVRWRRVTYGYLWLLDPDERVRADALRGLGDLVDQVAAAMALRARTPTAPSWAVGELLSDDAGGRARASEELRRDGLLPHDRLVVAALAPRDGGPVGPVNSWLLPRTVLSAPVGQRAALVLAVPDPRLAADVAERAARQPARVSTREASWRACPGPVAVDGRARRLAPGRRGPACRAQQRSRGAGLGDGADVGRPGRPAAARVRRRRTCWPRASPTTGPVGCSTAMPDLLLHRADLSRPRGQRPANRCGAGDPPPDAVPPAAPHPRRVRLRPRGRPGPALPALGSHPGRTRRMNLG